MAIRLGIRGFGGEIGATMTDALMSMRRSRFEGIKKATGGSIVAFIRSSKGNIEDSIRADRSFKKLWGGGSLEDNTASSYAYGRPIRDLQFIKDVPGRLRVVGADGRTLDIDYRTVPEINDNVPALNEADFLIDATGVGVKDVAPGYNFGNYGNLGVYPRMVTLASAPVKKVVSPTPPHQLNGMNNATPGKLNATGSCSTHAGVDYIRYVIKGLTSKLGIEEKDVYVQGGQFDAHHSLTPSDKPALLGYYFGGYVPQTTGFGDAAAVVYPALKGIGNIKAATGRYYSYQRLGEKVSWRADAIWANGISEFSLAMIVTIPRGKVGRDIAASDEGAKDKAKAAEVKELINSSLFEAAFDPEGRKHIGIVNPDAFTFKDNKKTGLFSLTSLSGMTPTTILPLGDNIEVVKEKGISVIDGKECETYTISVKNAAYDNRLGFTGDFMEEADRITEQMLGVKVFAGFNHQEDLGDNLALYNNKWGNELFADAIKKANGQIVLGHKVGQLII